MKTEAEEQTHYYHDKSTIQAAITAGFIHGLKVMERELSGPPLSCPHQ